MNWAILLLIIIVVDLVVLATCGIGGGMMTLVALNGYTSMPAPAAVAFLSSLYCFGVFIPALFGWVFVKARGIKEIRLWHILGASVGVNIILSIVIALVLMLIQRL